MALTANSTALNLQGGMVDIEMIKEVCGCLVQKVVGTAGWHDQMGGQDIFGGAGGPDMEIMNALHSR